MIVFVNSADFGFGVTYGRLEFVNETAAVIPTGTMSCQFKVAARPAFNVPSRPSFNVPERPGFKVGGC